MMTSFGVQLITLLIVAVSQTSAQFISTTPSSEESKLIITRVPLETTMPPVEALSTKILTEEITLGEDPSTEGIPTTDQSLFTEEPLFTDETTEGNLPISVTPIVPITRVRIPNAGQCLTPIGKNGTCIDLLQCKSLLSLLMMKPLLAENKLYLKSSQCGARNKTVFVCCPDQLQEFAAAPQFLISSSKQGLLPQPSVCGKIQSNRLYGGFTTEMDSYRWLALLEYSKGAKGSDHHCGGSLINDRYILTAAHCVAGLPPMWSLRSVRLGEWDTTTNRECVKFMDLEECADPHIDIPIEAVIPHVEYNPTDRNKLHDIALIRLASKINFTDFIHPICLPTNDNLRHAFDSQALDVVGWGVSPEGIWNTVKERTSATVIPLSNCRKRYAGRNVHLAGSQFCVEGLGKNYTCRSDSGGSIISFDTANKGLGSFYVAGIQSFEMNPCWTEGMPSVYTRVGDYLDWIMQNIQP